MLSLHYINGGYINAGESTWAPYSAVRALPLRHEWASCLMRGRGARHKTRPAIQLTSLLSACAACAGCVVVRLLCCASLSVASCPSVSGLTSPIEILLKKP